MIDIDRAQRVAALRPLAAANASQPADWRLGTMLHAQVLEQPDSGVASLRIGGAIHDARISFPVAKGERLLLEVVDLDPIPMLRPLRDPGSVDVVGPAMRQLLPRQSGMGAALARVEALMAAQQDLADLPPPVLAAARQLLQSLPTREALATPEGVRAALRNSGILLEAKLLAGGTEAEADATVAGDFKANLLRLAEALRMLPARTRGPATLSPQPAPQTPPQTAAPLLPPLRRIHPAAQAPIAIDPPSAGLLDAYLGDLETEVSAALARLQLHQLAALPSAEDPRQLWLLELPVRDQGATDVWQFRIEEEPQRRTPGVGNGWRVEMAVELPDLGTLTAVVALRAGRVSISFWAEQAATAALFNAHLQMLEARLDAAGITPGRISCRPGTAPGNPTDPPRAPLLEVTA